MPGMSKERTQKMNQAYKLIYHKEAVKFLAKQEKAIQERIASGLKGLIQDSPIGDIRPMKGQAGLYRLRIGTFRILFRTDHEERVVYVEAIGSRGDVYK
jgi:mRNA interferase RelE/StbE